MCGIFALLNHNGEKRDIIQKSFQKGAHRGPEYSVYKNITVSTDFGFHRLAINGLNPLSHQPITIGNIVLICNGEIYNYKELYKIMSITPKTDSDCEIIIHLYKQYGIEQCLQMLDGVFAFCLMEMNQDHCSEIYMARDPYGVRPLYIMHNPSNSLQTLCIASELKMIYDIYYDIYVKELNNGVVVEQFKPGTYSHYTMVHNESPLWKCERGFVPYHNTGFTSCAVLNENVEMKQIYANIQHYLINAVEKRCMNTERPIACLLSGGLDSSLITAIVNEYCKKNGNRVLETYSIGIEGSDDLAYAKIMADYLGTKHTEIILTEKDFVDAIPNVIYDIESYDTTTVRASIGNWLIGNYISKNSDAKVIFNGDGSDELTGGYLYVSCANNRIEYDKECRRLLKDIHTFDVLRSDKCISSHGLEPRTPFLDRAWTQYYLSIPYSIRCKTRNESEFKENGNTYVEKKLLRDAFHIDNFKNAEGNQLLPSEILYRQKEAFSDGVSKHTRSLYEITSEHAEQYFKTHNHENVDINNIVSTHESLCNFKNHLLPDTCEKLYYRLLFESHYQGLGTIIPYFWMPKYVETNDASARTLKIYK